VTALRRRLRSSVVLVAAALQGACYQYVPMTERPTPGMPVALEVTDEARPALKDRVGSNVERIEGRVVAVDADQLTLAVEKVLDLRGDDTKWNGESVVVARRETARTFHRRLDKVRTYLTVGLLVGGAVAFAASRSLSVFGNGTLEGPPAPPPPAN
jgi:hypothetical protein